MNNVFFQSFSELKMLAGTANNINHIALRTAKTLWSFGHSECNRVKPDQFAPEGTVLTGSVLNVVL